MFFTHFLRAKQKSKNVVVMLESMASNYKRSWVRERAVDKAQLILWDPLVQQHSVFREVKRIKGVKYLFPHQRGAAPKQEIEI